MIDKCSLKKAFFLFFEDEEYVIPDEEILTALKNYAQGLKEGLTDEPIDVSDVYSQEDEDVLNTFMDEIYKCKDEYIETIENLQIVNSCFVYSKREFYPDLLNNVLKLLVPFMTSYDDYCSDDNDIYYCALEDVNDFSSVFGYSIRYTSRSADRSKVSVEETPNNPIAQVSKNLFWVGEDDTVDEDVYKHFCEYPEVDVSVPMRLLKYAVNKDIAYFGNYDVSPIVERLIEESKIDITTENFDITMTLK